jgi:CRISPR/Cas system CSM-associated protein Csm2 small subunit
MWIQSAILWINASFNFHWYEEESSRKIFKPIKYKLTKKKAIKLERVKLNIKKMDPNISWR